jgi:glutathione synthase/RimK-type ligase-like ATP-grasp enzyme
VIVVWGSLDDPPVTGVLAALSQCAADHIHLDDGSLEAVSYDLRLEPRPAGWIEVGGRRISVSDLDGIYLRPGEQHGAAASTSAALLALAESAAATVVNRPAAGRSNLSKPFQLSMLAAAGLETPETLVTSDSAAALDFVAQHGRVVYKSISGHRSIVSTIDASSLRQLERIGHGPVQLQRWIEGLDVRVHVVGERLFATSVASSATDYRYASAEDGDVEMEPLDLPEQLGRLLVSVVAGMGLRVAGVDLRRTGDGEWQCFEVNPSPGFTYYEEHTGQPIAEAVAQLLISPHD